MANANYDYSKTRLDWIVFIDDQVEGIYKYHYLQDIIDKLPRNTQNVYRIEVLKDKFKKARDLPVVATDGVINLTFGVVDAFSIDNYLNARYVPDNIKLKDNVYNITQTDNSLAHRGLNKLNDEQKSALIAAIKSGAIDV